MKLQMKMIDGGGDGSGVSGDSGDKGVGYGVRSSNPDDETFLCLSSLGLG